MKKPVPACLVTELKSRCWFIGHGFKQFSTDGLAQGYEIIIRHPGFVAWARCHAPNLARRLPWASLNRRGKGHFERVFISDLLRMGLGVCSDKRTNWSGCRAPLTKLAFTKQGDLSVDCTDNPRFICDNLSAWLKESGQFPACKESFPTKAKCDLIALTPSVINPDAVVIHLNRLIEHFKVKQRRGEPISFDYKNLVAAVETFLTKDAPYRAYRERRLKVKRHKAPSPEVIALSCIAWDWQREGQKLPRLWPWLWENNFSLKELGVSVKPDWDNQLAALKKCHNKVLLAKPSHILPSEAEAREWLLRQLQIKLPSCPSNIP